MSWSPLSSFCSEVSLIASSAFVLSLPKLPDASGSRDEIYRVACRSLNTMLDKGQIDDEFFDYLRMHLDYAFFHGGAGGLQ